MNPKPASAAAPRRGWPELPAPLPGETEWLSPVQLPVQIGVYRRYSLGGRSMYSLWNGEVWCWNCHTPEQAAMMGDEASLCQTLPWCGLIYPPLEGYRTLPIWPAPTGRGGLRDEP